MKQTKSFLQLLFNLKGIFASRSSPFIFVFLIVLLIASTLTILSYLAAPPEAYSALAAVVPISLALINLKNQNDERQ